jgi:hypothetical protein
MEKKRHPGRINPPLNERNPKNTRKPSPPTFQAIQGLFSSYSVANATQKHPEKPAKQRKAP